MSDLADHVHVRPARAGAVALAALLDFCSEKELTAQTGHSPIEWPLIIVKELIDNALDAREEADIAPCVTVLVDDAGIGITDNGRGVNITETYGPNGWLASRYDHEGFSSQQRWFDNRAKAGAYADTLRRTK